MVGLTLVDTAETLVVYETALDPRLYVHRRHVRMDVLERSTTTTYCPYKGTASYWTARIGDADDPRRRMELRGSPARIDAPRAASSASTMPGSPCSTTCPLRADPRQGPLRPSR